MSVQSPPLTSPYSYDFEFEDSDDDQGGDVGIENKYYNAKQLKAENPDEAIVEFLGVPDLEQDRGDWSVITCDGYERDVLIT